MPEGPEVRTVAKTLAKEIIGQRLGTLWHSEHKLRREIDYAPLHALEDQIIDNVEAYGKILFINVDKKPAILAQLGMTGQLTITNVDDSVLPHTHIRWRLQSSDRELRYVDQRRFGLIDHCDDRKKSTILGKLGPDPFILDRASFANLIDTMKKSTRSVKDVLLDQSVIVGVGNIYAAEALFLAGIDPRRQAFAIEDDQYHLLLDAIILVLKRAFKNSGTTFSNYLDGRGKKGQNQHHLLVFQREGENCVNCKTTIMRVKQSGRSSFFCPSCQR